MRTRDIEKYYKYDKVRLFLRSDKFGSGMEGMVFETIIGNNHYYKDSVTDFRTKYGGFIIPNKAIESIEIML